MVGLAKARPNYRQYYYYYGITGQTAVADKAPKLQITTNYNEKQCM